MGPKRLLALLVFVEFWVTCLGAAPTCARTLRVEGPDGEPLAGAAVRAFRVPKSRNILETVAAPLVGTSDELGRVPLDLAASSQYVLVVDHPRTAPLILLDQGGSTVRLRTSSGARLHVQVVPPPGAAISQGKVCARWMETLPAIGLNYNCERCGSGPAGDIDISGLPSRDVSLAAAFRGLLAPVQHVVPSARPAQVKLRAGVLLSGVVQDMRGAAIPEARLLATTDLQASSADDGKFELTVERLPIDLRVEASGYVPTSVAVTAGKEKGFTLRLQQAAAILATVVSGRSEPLTSMAVRVERRDGEEWAGDDREVTLGTRGELVLPIAVAGEYRVRIRADGHREWVSPDVVVEEGARVDLGVARLDTGGIIRGLVVGGEHADPLPGVEVSLVARSTELLAAALRGEAIPRVATSSAGSFEIAGLEMGSYEVRLEHPSFALATAQAGVTEDGVVDLGTIDLDAGLELSGRVVDRRERGLPGVRVELLAGARDAQVPVTATTTEENGRFHLRPVAAGDYLVRAMGRRLLVSQEVSLTPDDREPTLVLMSNGVTVKGLVVRRGEPVEGGAIEIHSALDPASHRGIVIVNTEGRLPVRRQILGDSSSEVAAVVGENGRFELSEVTPGPVRLTFTGADGETCERELTVPEAAETAIEVDVAGLPLLGRVLDRDTRRGVAATISATRLGSRRFPGVRASEDGSFSIPDLDGGQYRIEAAAEGYEPAAVVTRVREGAAPVTILLRAGEASSFSVRLMRPSGPAAFVPISLLDANGAMVGSLLTDVEGRRHFDEIPDGRYAVVWADPLGGVGTSGWLTVGSGSRSFEGMVTTGSDIRLACEAAACRGSLVTLLQVFDSAGVEIGRYLPGLFAVRFSAQGSLALGRLSPGSYVVVVDVAGRRMQRELSIQGAATVVDVDIDR